MVHQKDKDITSLNDINLTSSSPFVEQPRSSFKMEEDELQQVTSKLQFQLKSAQTELNLERSGRKDIVNKFEILLKQKNEEIDSLKQNFDYIYNQRDQLKSKLENAENIKKTNIESLENQLDNLTKKLNVVESENKRLRTENSSLKLRSSDHSNSFTYLEEENKQLKSRIEEYELEMKKLINRNNALLEEQQNMNTSQTANHVLLSKCDSLQKTNTSLQLKVDELLQHKTSLDLLKQKNESLNSKLLKLRGIEETNYHLEIENISLKRKFDEFKEILGGEIEFESVELKLGDFITKYKDLQNSNLVIQDKYEQMKVELDQSRSQISKLEHEKSNQLLPQIKSLNEILSSRQNLIEKLERQKLLNIKEIEYLRESLKSLDEINLKKSSDKPSDSNNAYIASLEKLVDQYKHEKEEMLKNHANDNNFQTGEKRTHIEDISTSNTSVINKLEKENLELLLIKKKLEDANSSLRNELKSFNDIKTKKEQLRVVQMRSNPLANDQLIKQHTLDCLRKENEDLINSKFNKETWIPKSVFERQENDMAILQNKIDQYIKRINRLKDAYSKKSIDILSIISKFFGYSVEFLPSAINPEDLTSSRIKLTSKAFKKTESPPHLIIDVHTKSLKVVGSQDFKNLCEELVNTWVTDKNSIPCFLSALNIEIFNTS